MVTEGERPAGAFHGPPARGGTRQRPGCDDRVATGRTVDRSAFRVRLARDYYVRVDSNDYSVDPRFISRFVDIHANAATVTITSGSSVVGVHERCWAKHTTISDPAHVTAAKGLRKSLADDRQARERAERHHSDGHPVMLRVLSDYDALFGSDFPVTTPTAVS